MFDKFIRFAIEQRLMVLLLVLAMALTGIYSYQRLPIDAVPDITNIQVQINTAASGYSPLEAEQRITVPVETAMAGLPHLEQTRSLSRYGLSQVTVVFKEGTNIHFARQLVNERIEQAKNLLPPGINPAMGPVSTGLGEIVMWTVDAKQGALRPDGQPWSPTDLREIQDWIVKPQLRNVPGVTEINTIGGYAKQFLVAPRPEKLLAHGLSLQDLVSALERNNSNQGAGYIEKNGQQYLVRAPAQLKGMADIGNIMVSRIQGVPVRIRDVADVRIGSELRTGAAMANGHEVVLGTVFMLTGENSRSVARAVVEKLAQINRTLPGGVVANIVYDRTTLVDKAIDTVKANLLEGALLVVTILFLFLGNLRAAVIVALVIPLSMLFTFSGMAVNHVSANLMSLGALDFGIIIDGAVVIVENCVRRLAHVSAQARAGGRMLTRSERLHEVFLAANEARRPLVYGQLIIMVVYLPIFALAGVEGKMFHPMAFTVVIALLGAMLLSLTFIPAAVAVFMGKDVSEKPVKVMQWAQQLYQPVLLWALRHVALVLVTVLVLLGLSGLLAARMGSEFVPTMDEGDIALHALRIPGTSLSQAVAMQAQLEQRIRQFPEVALVFSKLGTAEIASDPMPPNVADTYLMLKPRADWPDPQRSKADLLRALQAAVQQVPGNNYEFTQPIQMRFNELLSGVRSDVALKLFGDDMERMNRSANELAAVLSDIPGAQDVKVEPITGLPLLTIALDREKVLNAGLTLAEVQDEISSAIGGKEAGAIFEGDRRFEIQVRLPEDLRNDPEVLKRLPIRLPMQAQNADGREEGHASISDNRGNPGSAGIIGSSGKSGTERAAFVTLGDLATLETGLGPNQVSRENGKRLVIISANVRERDIGSFIREAQQQLGQKVTLPSGYWLSWGGTFEQLESASKRLQIVVPLALGLVFLLLFAMFNNIKDGLLVFTGVPFALTGGILALWLRDIPLSISAGVGFIALSGVAVLNGLVMIAFIRSLLEGGKALDEAIVSGALTRLRPVLMTALVASLGFIPMALASGTGAEVQRPLATVVIGGILSSTLLTLLVLPLLYRLAHRNEA